MYYSLLLSIALYSIMNIYYILLIQSPTDEHLGTLNPCDHNECLPECLHT